MKKHFFFWFACLLCVLLPLAMGEGTLAGTQIKNQASATYKDAGGNALSSTSNEVITTVQPKYSFSVTPDGTAATPGYGQEQIATIGATVYFPYKLLNSSNTSETFTMNLPETLNSTFTPENIKIYRDGNGNGIVDPGDSEITTGSNFGPVGPDSLFHFIVAYDVPTTATSGQIAYVTPSVTSVNGATTDDENYNKTTVVSGPVVTANITASPTSLPAGDQVEYRISGSNTGNTSARSQTGISFKPDNLAAITVDGILVTNELPKDSGGNHVTTYVAGSATGNGPAGSVLVYSNNGINWYEDPTEVGAAIQWVGYLMRGPNTGNNVSEEVLAPGQLYELKYRVTIDAGTPPQILSDDAQVLYRDTTQNLTTTTNTADVTITAIVSGGVQLGARNLPNSDEILTNGNNGNYQEDAPAGSTITFTNTVRNTGNANDIFNLTPEKVAGGTVVTLTIDGASTNVTAVAWPTNATVLLYQIDGSTPLSDTNNDGTLDTGVLAKDTNFSYVVKIILPGTTAAETGDYLNKMTARSVNFPLTSFDETHNLLRGTTAPGVTLWTRDPDGNFVETRVNQEGVAGTTEDFRLRVNNTGSQQDTFNLTSTLPNGWTVQYYLDANNDGIPDTLTPITNITVGSLDLTYVIARVTIPSDATPLASPGYDVTFRTTSTLDPTKTDSVTNGVYINRFAGVTFEPDRNGTGIPGGTVTYTHVVRNTGNATDSFTLSYDSSAGWTYVFYDDANTPIPGNVIANLPAGDSFTVVVKGFIPTGEPVNTVEVFTATATSQYDNTKLDTVTDTTVVIAGVLQLTKQVANITQATGPATSNEGRPLDILEYSVDYRNLSTLTLTELVVVDPVPQYTEFVSMTTTMTGPAGETLRFEWSADGVNYTNYATTPPVPASQVKFVRWVFNDGAATPTWYNIPAGFDSATTTKTLQFRVRIK